MVVARAGPGVVESEAMIGWIRKRRRQRLLGEQFPEACDVILGSLPAYQLLPQADRNELRSHVQVLLGEKRFEGCGGLEITDEIRVTIVAHAAILLLHRETDYYPQLESILVYPEAYGAPGERHIGDYVVEEGVEVREGESWYRGSMVLSWADVRQDSADPGGGRNVVFHEFAHQLDDESGNADGTPVLPNRALWEHWVEVCEREFEALAESHDRGRRTLIDPYGAESPSEFFAVVTECFFGRPAKLRTRHPDLYDVFSQFYQQDPASW